MEQVLEYLTLSRIIAVLLFLASFWLLRIILKKERRNLFRGVLVFLFFLLILIYINQSDTHKLTLGDMQDMIFPPRPLELNYRVVADVGSAQHITTYYFDDPRPRLSVTLDDDGKHLHITNPASVNRVLAAMNLPEVEEGAQELVSITRSQLHTSLYRWEKYPLGVLFVEKAVQQNKDTLESYHVIANIQIRKRR